MSIQLVDRNAVDKTARANKITMTCQQLGLPMAASVASAAVLSDLGMP
jgi:hypothetical protein